MSKFAHEKPEEENHEEEISTLKPGKHRDETKKDYVFIIDDFPHYFKMSVTLFQTSPKSRIEKVPKVLVIKNILS